MSTFSQAYPTISRGARKAALFALYALMACSHARPPGDLISADRPGIANGAGVVGRQVVQVESGFERDHSRRDGIDERDAKTPTLIRVGISRVAELRIETDGWSSSRIRSDSANTTESGLAPVSAGFKLALREADDARHIPATGIIVRAFPKSGSGAFKDSHFSGDVTFAADLALSARTSIHPNLGLATSTDDRERRFTSIQSALTLVYAPRPTLQPFLDVGFAVPEGSGAGSSLLVDVGVAWIFQRDWQLDSEAGWSARGRTTPSVFWGAGISRRF